MKLIKDGSFLFLRFFLIFQFYYFWKDEKNHGLFPVIKTRLVGVTKNGKDPPEHCCRSELMHSENAPNYIFSMFEVFCEDIKLDKRNFDERYGKSFYEAIENFEASVSIG